ncbi:GNAT family N-acetyltransferase [Terribacillus saccharophilus]|uniref:GNAT family N-acetyltransferase n=1 Tax=Terribacillus saccharophilus TaxID=361277 RepID=UPI003982BA22
MKIRKLSPSEKPPVEVLLEADPSRSRIESYLRKGSSYVAELKEHVIGIYVLLPINQDTAEIINISVKKDIQGKGIGRKLISHAMEQSRAQGFAYLVVGTGNSSISQIAFYQKCGFRMKEIEEDYFLRHYEKPIYENGIQCRDMIRFSYIL